MTSGSVSFVEISYSYFLFLREVDRRNFNEGLKGKRLA